MKLKLVNIITEARDTKSFQFIPDTKFEHIPGQYLYLTLGSITKQFTISSSPTEKFIQITTRIRKESEFKQNLNKLEIGAEVEARAPFGTFVFPSIINSSSLTINYFLAGGIGITPFRSMIKYNIDKKLGIKTNLIYSNSDSDFVFKKELDSWQKENDFIKIYYHDSSVLGRISSKSFQKLYAMHYTLNPTVWVVGPTPFVNAMEDILEELRIPQDQVRTEKFTGY